MWWTQICGPKYGMVHITWYKWVYSFMISWISGRYICIYFHSFFAFNFSTGKDGIQKDYYTLECILFLLNNVNLPHALYVKQAGVCSFQMQHTGCALTRLSHCA